jgi:uncharacterized protein
MAIPSHIAGQKYISLTTFKKDGTPVRTPVWFGERDGRLYVITRNDSWKYKRIRNNPQVQVAPCSIRDKVTGPDFSGLARILPPEDWKAAHKLIKQKYWLARLSLPNKKNVLLEIEFAA